MTREELESVVWRELSTLVSQVAFVDAILTAADSYATAEAVAAIRAADELGAAT